MNSLPQNLGQGSLPQGNYGLFPPLTQPFAQTTANPPSLLTNQPLGPPLFKEGKPETAASSVANVSLSNVFSTVSSNTFSLTTSTATAATKAAPVNVVITASDPLPTNKSTTVQPILSVTIPPQHLKGNLPPKSQPHNYQIPLPATSVTPVSVPSVLKQAPPSISTQNILSNVAPPRFSAIPDKSPVKSAGLGFQIEKSLSQSFTSNPEKSDLNKSADSTSSADEIDPCPDFKPIIPLPDEVPVNTGEENENVLFCCRAKLFRYVVKEWRERGLGDIKILHNPNTNKVRILMRRDQVHKVCANHFVTKDMTLAPMPSSDRAFVWAANDFADQVMVLEKFCVKFKTQEEAQKFNEAFQGAVKLVTESEGEKIETIAPIATTAALKNTNTTVTTTTAASTSVFGGFVFTSTPTFKPKEDKPEIVEVINTETPKASPFADFSFGKNTTSVPSSFTQLQTQVTSPAINKDTSKVVPASPGDDDHSAIEFEPTVEFKPVIPLPAIVDVKTGEENAEVLHECRAKLLRYDSAAKEWKERGIGNMRILKEDKTIRLLMRREQVLKVCCNHQLLKNMNFSKMSNPKALSWCAQDFSEEVLKTEMFALRFKTVEQADEFLNALQSAQASLNDNNVLQETEVEKKQERNRHAKMKTEPEKSSDAATTKQPSTWGERFKPKSGSWNCKTCFIVNESKDNYCVACETPKHDSLPKKEVSAASGPTFSITVPSFTDQSKSSFKFGMPQSDDKVQPAGFGDAFKPKEGSWSCKICYVRNDPDKLYCVSCESPKDDSVPKKESSIKFGSQSESSFKFGVQPQSGEKTQSSGFGDQFRPKEGSWSCKTCYISNDGDKLYCVACESPKDDTVPKKEPSKGINLTNSGSSFSFGIPPASNTSDASNFTFGSKSTQLPTGFVFGAATTGSKESPLNLTAKPFTFTPPDQLAKDIDKTNDNKSNEPNKEKFVFGSPQKHTFDFTPKSPRRISGGHGDEESDGSFVEEEADNIYFKPVIPLPEKVEVKTGEEGEEVLYCHRAKLFRFVDGEWKERGIGDVKILFHPGTKKLR